MYVVFFGEGGVLWLGSESDEKEELSVGRLEF